MEGKNPYDWQQHPKAEELLLGYLSRLCDENGALAKLEHELEVLTSSRLFDWVDHFVVDPDQLEALQRVGFVTDQERDHSQQLHHPGALLPRVVVENDGGHGVAIMVEEISDYLMVRGLQKVIEGTIQSGYRRCLVDECNQASFWVVERRGTWTMEPTQEDEAYVQAVLDVKEQWKTRPRNGVADHDLDYAIRLARQLGEEVGVTRAAWAVLEVEREYWQSRNKAAQLQKARQDSLGMGWANHDHHTFRSSRRHFRALVQLFEQLGFHCRERFYAGEEAGWGAQVMENSACNAVLFLDVDLDPEELEIDFAHEQLPDRGRLGTIGLWCGLHGDSILGAGMHHLEAQFLFDRLTEDLHHIGIGMMEPFSNFPYLRQAFTQGELWHVQPERIEALLDKGLITSEEADKFSRYGAVGSHMENLQRRNGYKGFNQKNVSFIIKKTDPRSLTP